MRTILLGLALLAGFKVWFQDHTYRAAMADAVVEAYRERAVEVCRRSALKRPTDTSSIWGLDSRAEITMGDSDVGVAIWDTQNPLWNRRFRDLHVILTSTAAGNKRCAYDVRQGNASFPVATR